MSHVIKLSAPATREFWEIPVLFEDEWLLAVNKPARLLSSPDRYDPNRPNLMRLLHEGIARGAAWAAERNLTYLANAHRLDFETAGVMLLAKDKPTLIALASQFSDGNPVKTYAALVHGHPRTRRFEMTAKLAPHPVTAGLMRVDPKNGKQAATKFEVREMFQGCALLQCRPRTGRTHQIRVHLRHAQLPIVGDVLYGGQPLLLSKLKRGYHLRPNEVEKPLISRVALHAEALQITHPVTGNPLIVTAPWPKDFTAAVKYLRRYAPASMLGEQSDQPAAEQEGEEQQEDAGEV